MVLVNEGIIGFGVKDPVGVLSRDPITVGSRTSRFSLRKVSTILQLAPCTVSSATSYFSTIVKLSTPDH